MLDHLKPLNTSSLPEATARTFTVRCPVCASVVVGASSPDGVVAVACRNACDPIRLVQLLKPPAIGMGDFSRAQICELVLRIAEQNWRRRTARVGFKVPMSSQDVNTARAQIARRHDIDLQQIPAFEFEFNAA